MASKSSFNATTDAPTYPLGEDDTDQRNTLVAAFAKAAKFTMDEDQLLDLADHLHSEIRTRRMTRLAGVEGSC
jgi:hypothetical protein